MRSARITCSSSLLLWALWSLTLPESGECYAPVLCQTSLCQPSPVAPSHTWPLSEVLPSVQPKDSVLPAWGPANEGRGASWENGGGGLEYLPFHLSAPGAPEMSHEFSIGRSPGLRWECSHSSGDEAGKERGRWPGTPPAAGCPLEEKGPVRCGRTKSYPSMSGGASPKEALTPAEPAEAERGV